MMGTQRAQPSRSVRPLFWMAGLLVVAVLLSACSGRRGSTSNGEILAEYLPADWSYVTTSPEVQGFQAINIDADSDDEWLLFYRYDSAAGESNGPIGGLIYNVQANADPYNPDVVIPFPFQPMAFFVPYRLLPDWVAGKGQGYLGDADVIWETIKAPSTLEQPNELLVQGVGANGGVTRVSIFRWAGMTQGYTVTYFQGSYGASIEADREEGDVVNRVVTLNALNDRSKLCERTEWTRQGDSASFSSSQPAIVFCLGDPPPQPTYPEAVVLAYLLAQNNALVLPASLSQVQAVAPAKVTRVVTLAYPGTATVTGTGASAVSRMAVETVIESPEGLSRVSWVLEEQRPTTEDKTTRWRIVSAEKG